MAEAQHGPNQRSREQMAANECGNRVSRQSDHRGAAEPARHKRLSRTHGDFVEAAFHAETFGHRTDEVVVANRGSSDGDDEIRSLRQTKRCCKGSLRIARDGQDAGLGSDLVE